MFYPIIKIEVIDFNGRDLKVLKSKRIKTSDANSLQLISDEDGDGLQSFNDMFAPNFGQVYDLIEYVSKISKQFKNAPYKYQQSAYNTAKEILKFIKPFPLDKYIFINKL